MFLVLFYFFILTIRTASNNIEDIYSELYETNQLELKDEIEKGIIGSLCFLRGIKVWTLLKVYHTSNK